MKIYENDVLVRDFIPVKRKLDDEICMYDKVTKTFFTNGGSGTFKAGYGVTELEQNLDDIYANIQADLLPENIKAGVIILGVTGTYEGD